MVVEDEEKCVGNAEEAVDDALDGDTSNMLCVRSSYGDGGCDDDRDDDDEH